MQQRSGAGAEYVTTRAANNDARVKAIQAFAKDDAAIAAADQARDQAAIPFLR